MTSRKDGTGRQDTELVDGGGEDSAEAKRNGPDVADIEEGPSTEDSEGEGGEGEEDDLIEEDDDYIYDEEVEPSPVNPHVLHRRHSTREPLIPLEFTDCEQALQHFVQVFEERYGEAHPHFYIGTLKNAVKEVTDVQNPQEARPLLIFVHSDKSVMAHVFCTEVLCQQIIMDYLNANFITWPWDITHDVNKNILLAMIDECFNEEPATDNESKECSFTVHKPWFTQPQPSSHQRSPLWPKAENVTPKSVLKQLTSNVDDLPACAMFYPVPGQPHSIQGTWVASKGGSNMLDSFLTALMACIEDFNVLSQQQSQQTQHTGEGEDRQYQHQQGYSDQYSQWSHAAPSQDSSHSMLATPPTNQTFGMDFSWLTNIRVITSPPSTTHDTPADQEKPADQDQPAVDQVQLTTDQDQIAAVEDDTVDQDTPITDRDKPVAPDIRDDLDLSADELHRPVIQDTGTSVDPDPLETMVQNTAVTASDITPDPHSPPSQYDHPAANTTLDKE